MPQGCHKAGKAGLGQSLAEGRAIGEKPERAGSCVGSPPAGLQLGAKVPLGCAPLQREGKEPG